MDEDNTTFIVEFHLLGFQNLYRLKIIFFLFLLITHIATLSVNLCIPLTVLFSRHLHTPMYLFLTQLASSEILFTTNIIPKLLFMTLSEGITVSVSGCVIQFYIFSVCTNAESMFLMIMSYDRYLAICNPLHYSSLMGFHFCLRLIIFSWLFSFASTFIVIIQLSTLYFCGSNVIDHYYCDLTPLLEHSCSDIFFVKMQIYVFAIPIAVFPFVFIILTYVKIMVTILNISSSPSKQKAFSTCSSHLTVVFAYYLTLIAIYVIPSSGSSRYVNKFLSLLYTVVTPLFNPIIYTLRNQEIRSSLAKYINKKNNRF